MPLHKLFTLPGVPAPTPRPPLLLPSSAGISARGQPHPLSQAEASHSIHPPPSGSITLWIIAPGCGSVSSPGRLGAPPGHEPCHLHKTSPREGCMKEQRGRVDPNTQKRERVMPSPQKESDPTVPTDCLHCSVLGRSCDRWGQRHLGSHRGSSEPWFLCLHNYDVIRAYCKGFSRRFGEIIEAKRVTPFGEQVAIM